MQGEFRKCTRRFAALLALSVIVTAPASARDPALFDRNGQPRSERGQWVYRIVAQWGNHVEEAYRIDPRRWVDSMSKVFAHAPLPALRQAANARSFSAMNDALLAAPIASPASTTAIDAKALGDPDRDLVYVPVTPCRILDTRISGGPIAANSVRDFDMADVTSYAIQGGDTSNCNVGDQGSFAAAALNITVVQPNAPGYITAYPHLANRPTAATANYVAGDIRNSLAILRLDQTTATYEFSVYSFAQTHLVADIVGYFSRPSATAADCVELASAQSNVRTLVNSPACPSGYSIMSGNCELTAFSSSFGIPSLVSSYSSEQKHICRWLGNNNAVGISIARCCRIIGQ
jgi:hypothetical protein